LFKGEGKSQGEDLQGNFRQNDHSWVTYEAMEGKKAEKEDQT